MAAPNTCAEPGCNNKAYPKHKWDAINLQKTGWFFQKDGTVWCPDHTPEWVEKWRAKKKMALVTKDNCPFCERIRQGKVLGEYKGAVFFEPLGPVTEGHLLFVPKEHITPREPSAWIDANMSLAGAVKYYRIEQGARGTDFNLILNVGEDAGQTIEHMHLHYVPRRPGDGLKLPWTDAPRKCELGSCPGRPLTDRIFWDETFQKHLHAGCQARMVDILDAP